MNTIIPTPQGAVKELVERRGVTSKTFDMGSGKFQTLVDLGPAHYEDPTSKKLEDINLDVAFSAGKYRLTTVPYNLTVSKNAISFSYESKRGGKVDATLVEIGGVPVKDLPLQINPRTEYGRVYWDEVLPGLDMYITASPVGVRFHKLIKNASVATDFLWEYVEDLTASFVLDHRSRGRDNFNDLDDPKRTIRPDRQRKIEVADPSKTPDDLITNPGRKTYRITSAWTGRVKKLDPVTRIGTWVDEPLYPVRLDPTFGETAIQANANDGEENINTSGWDASGSVNFVGVATNVFYNAGFLWSSVTVDQGATIDSATLTINVAATFGTPNADLWGDDVDDAAAWGSGSRPSQITQTTASVAVDSPGTGTEAIDVATIVQEIVNRGSWVNSNDMRFGLIEDAPGTSYDLISITDYGTGAPNADRAKLIINWTAAGGGAAIGGAYYQQYLGTVVR